jgi:radical SAM protein with 4Fe4S-binding SPASM domain
LYEFAADHFSRVTIETNGTIQPEGVWSAFLKNKPENVSVSLDSNIPEIHDSFRGKHGAWRQTIDFLGKLIDNKIPNQVIMSITDHSKTPVEDMIRFAESLGNINLKINLVTPTGRGKTLSFYDRVNIFELLQFIDWFDTNAPDWVSITVPAALLPINRLKHLGYCPVRNLLGVLPDGRFSLCGVAFSREDMLWGSYPEVSVRNAWNNSPVLKMIRKSVPNKLTGICAKCIHKETCIGRCVVNNLETGGSIASPDLLCQRAWDNRVFPSSRLLD